MVQIAIEESDRVGAERITVIWDRNGFTKKNYDSDFFGLFKGKLPPPPLPPNHYTIYLHIYEKYRASKHPTRHLRRKNRHHDSSLPELVLQNDVWYSQGILDQKNQG